MMTKTAKTAKRATIATIATTLPMLVVAAALLTMAPRDARAGCGCEKPPPPPAGIRPNATWVGAEVRIFSEVLSAGAPYNVRFTSGVHAGTTATIATTAVQARDLADGQFKAQIVVDLPPMPLGPVAVEVMKPSSGEVLVAISDSSLTSIPAPIEVPNEHGTYTVPGYRAAVSRDGVTYLSFDLMGVTMPLVTRAQALGYPMRFSGDDVVFYNAQGFTMQLLDGSIPGLFAIDAGDGVDSDLLQYSRHEFNTHFLRHEERESHAVDATDPNWHVDGSAHVGHDKLVLAMTATLPGGVPPAGATPAFPLVIEALSLFRHGLAASAEMELTDDTVVYGPVRANTELKMTGQSTVHGTGRAATFAIDSNAGATDGYIVSAAAAFMPVEVPVGATDVGTLYVENSDTHVLGPGSYVTDVFKVNSSATLIVDNVSGPVTLYVTEKVDVAGTVTVTDSDPEKFAIYVSGVEAKFQDTMGFTGVVYAPDALVDISGSGSFYGAFVGQKVLVSDDVTLAYEADLGGTGGAMAPPPSAPDVDSSGSGSGDAARNGADTSDAGTHAASDADESIAADEEPVAQTDEVQITRARYSSKKDRLTIRAESSGADAVLTVTVDGFVADAQMIFDARRGRYQYRVDKVGETLDGSAVVVHSSLGGTAVATVQ